MHKLHGRAKSGYNNAPIGWHRGALSSTHMVIIMNDKLTNVQPMIGLAAAGQVAVEYRRAIQDRKKARQSYVEVRNRWLSENGHGRTMRDAMNDPEFFNATDDAYKAFIEARRVERNTLRRLMCRCRKVEGRV